MVCCSGRCVVATADIPAKQFIVEYCGELISAEEGNRREDQLETGYRYFFEYQGSKYWSVFSNSNFCKSSIAAKSSD